MGAFDYLEILAAVEQLPFPMGKKLLLKTLQGEGDEDIRRLRLHRETCFGCLSGHTSQEIEGLLSQCMAQGYLAKGGLSGKRWLRVYQLTEKGAAALASPPEQQTHSFSATQITEQDRKLFSAFGFFLSPYNDEQKKAITTTAERVLCVAGAGSGKTTVLTKRIEFLVRFRSVPKERILAITFTRKARQEMEHRLSGLVRVETFNSFSEKLLQEHGEHLYGRPVKMITYRERMRLLHHAIASLKMEPAEVLDQYFSDRQLREKPKDALLRQLMNDCFAIIDYYANSDEDLQDFSGLHRTAAMVHALCSHIRREMEELGLRDYSDQVRDALRLLREHPRLKGQYDHVLVDEYQDVNVVQKRLLDVLQPQNLFAVGDPRQSIFGWRGSRISYILDFPHEHEGCEVVVLKQNYRSRPQIVAVMNHAIRRLALPDLVSAIEGDGRMFLHKLASEDDEHAFIAERILKSEAPREDIFVLTRTNRQLEEIAKVFSARGIPHVLRKEDARLVEASQGEVTLSTVHAIKGLEANIVYVAGCTTQYFPCVASDNEVIEHVKGEHDREEEELRLFYVAVSRARQELHLTHAGTLTPYVNAEMQRLLGKDAQSVLAQYEERELFERLREWRSLVSRRRGLPAYMVLPDVSLKEIARKLPSTQAELKTIRGIGPEKAHAYGEDLLTLLKR